MGLFGIAGGDPSDIYYNYGPLLNGVGIAMMCVSGVAVVFRFLARRIARQPIKLDDYLIIAGLLLSWSETIVQIVGAKHGFGKHIEVLTAAEIKQCLILIYADQIIYILAVATIKFSLVAFIRRVFDVQATRLPAYIIVGIIMSWLIALELVAIFSCRPIRGFWDRGILPTCVDTTKYYYGIGIPNLVTDVLILLFPLPMVWRLQMPLSQKIAVSGIFTLGAFIVAISFIHIFTVLSIGDNLDITWALVSDALWNVIECNVGVTLACLSSMRPLLRYLLGQKQNSTAVKRSDISSSQVKNHARHYQWSGIKRTDQLTVSSFSRLHDNEEEVAGDKIELGQLRTKTQISAGIQEQQPGAQEGQRPELPGGGEEWGFTASDANRNQGSLR